MGKSLVLAEKPSVGRDLAKVLGCNQKGPGCFIGSKYIVTWALGHLVTLADPETYDDRYKSWNLDDLPMLPPMMKLVVMKQTSKQFAAIKQLMHRNDIDDFIIATDAGREGELVARWIIEKVGWKKPIKRLWISSQTDKAIQEGFRNLKPGSAYENLYAAAVCRAEADWYVGLNVTRALTCKYNAQLSAGRVQTPTLAMVVERESQIKNFVPKDYWTISASVNGFVLNWQDKAGQTRIFDPHKVEPLLAKLSGHPAEIIELKKELKKEAPPLAYDLTELQRDGNKKYGFSAKKTLSIMQQLYEHHKIVTYPRTDSRYITEDIVPTLPERLSAMAVGPYAKAARELIRNKVKATKRLVNNAKVSDHHAIIPTEQGVNLTKLSVDEARIFDLIARRFLAVLSLPYEYEQTTIQAKINNESFIAKGKTVKAQGWKAAYTEDSLTEEENDEREQTLPDLKTKDRLNVLRVEAALKQTKPPKRFTEATLLTAMEHPGQKIEDASLRETLEKTSGLGTPATRADIIEKLFNSFYMERNGKEIIPTSKGTQLIELVPEELRAAELTAQWEQKLHEISQGRIDQKVFIKTIKDYAAQLVTQVVGSSQTYRHDNMTRAKCPDCGKFLLKVKGKKGELLVCQDRECGYRQGVSIQSNARCPQCHKKMDMKGEGDHKIFTCVCGYREKLSSFKKRKEEEGKKGSSNKREVAKYLKEQKESQLTNTALADALAKLKLDTK